MELALYVMVGLFGVVAGRGVDLTTAGVMVALLAVASGMVAGCVAVAGVVVLALEVVAVGAMLVVPRLATVRQIHAGSCSTTWCGTMQAAAGDTNRWDSPGERRRT